MNGYITRFFTEQNGLRLSSGYGPRRYKVNGKWVEDFHWGLDFTGPRGTPILCPRAGIVTHSGFDSSAKGYGHYVGVQIASGHRMVFAHMDSREVRKGDRIKKGDFIGPLGKTGFCSGPHLHFQLNTPDGGVRGVNAWGDPDLFDWRETMDKLIVIHSIYDRWAGDELERKLKVPVLRRDYLSQEIIDDPDITLILVGGPKIERAGEVVHLAGADRYETAQVVIDFLRSGGKGR